MNQRPLHHPQTRLNQNRSRAPVMRDIQIPPELPPYVEPAPQPFAPPAPVATTPLPEEPPMAITSQSEVNYDDDQPAPVAVTGDHPFATSDTVDTNATPLTVTDSTVPLHFEPAPHYAALDIPEEDPLPEPVIINETVEVQEVPQLFEPGSHAAEHYAQVELDEQNAEHSVLSVTLNPDDPDPAATVAALQTDLAAHLHVNANSFDGSAPAMSGPTLDALDAVTSYVEAPFQYTQDIPESTDEAPASDTPEPVAETPTPAEIPEEPAVVWDDGMSQPCLTVNMDVDPRTPVANPKQAPISLPRYNRVLTDRKTETWPSDQVLYTQPNFKPWYSSIAYASLHSTNDNAFISSTERPGSDWGQSAKHEGRSLGLSRPKITPKEGGGRLTGAQALAKMQSELGLGSTIHLPLWHSGIWIGLKAPSDGELLLLERRISNEKSALGAETGGAVYSSSNVYLQHHLYDFLIDHIVETNIKGWDTDSGRDVLHRVLRITDEQTLALAQAVTIYPGGYAFEQPCVDNPAKCMYTATAQLNLARLFWVDRSRLSPAQLKHMSNRLELHSEEEILAYQQMGTANINRTIDVSPTIQMVLKTPTIQEAINSGYRWVDQITKLVQEAFQDSLPDDERDEVLTQQANASEMRQYGHMVERILFTANVPEGSDAPYVEGIDDIEMALTEMSGDADSVRAFLSGVTNHINDSTVAVVALPNYPCPDCGTPLAPANAKHPHLVPLEATNTFFTLKTLKLMKGQPMQTVSLDPRTERMLMQLTSGSASKPMSR